MVRATQGIACSTTAPDHVEAQDLFFYNWFFSTSFRVTRPLVGHPRGARNARKSYGARPRQFMSTHVEARNSNFTIGFSQRVFGWPARWWVTRAARATQGIAWSATAPTHVEAQNPSYYFLNNSFGSPARWRVTRAARYAVNRAGCDSTDSC